MAKLVIAMADENRQLVCFVVPLLIRGATQERQGLRHEQGGRQTLVTDIANRNKIAIAIELQRVEKIATDLPSRTHEAVTVEARIIAKQWICRQHARLNSSRKVELALQRLELSFQAHFF